MGTFGGEERIQSQHTLGKIACVLGIPGFCGKRLADIILFQVALQLQEKLLPWPAV